MSAKAIFVKTCGNFLRGPKSAASLQPGPLILFASFVVLIAGKQLNAATTFANGVSQGTISIPELNEASGMVASRNNEKVLWTHNDSGDPAQILAIDTQGRKLGTYALTGASHTDYEDIRMGPGPVTNVLYLYVADIGDNAESRSNIRVYQIPEPAVYARQYTNPVTAGLKGVRAITLTYPDDAHNAESLFVDPWTGDLFVVTKEFTTSHVYSATKASLEAGTNITLTLVRSVAFDIPSAADISPTGTEIIIRQEEFARLWLRSPGQTISNALATTPVNIPVIGTPTEANGEAITFDAIGSGYYTISESLVAQPLYYFTRTSGDGPRAPQTIVPAGATWKYFDKGTDQGTSWRSPGFIDASWSNGVAQLGYGNGDEKTVVSYGSSATSKYVTTYFRKSFVVENAACLESLTLRLVVDDGVAVYLNGTRVLNYQLATNATYNALATASQPTTLEDTWFSFPVNPALLLNGTNTLAVEIHQAARNSSDISFDLQLTGMESTIPRFMSYSLGTNSFQFSICGPSTSNVTVQATRNFVTWTNIGSVTLTNGIGNATDPNAKNFDYRFYRIAR